MLSASQWTTRRRWLQAGRLSLLLLPGCSAPAGAPTTAAGAVAAAGSPAAPPPRDAGTAVDSLDGLPAHRFGQPLRAFPGLVRGEGAGPLRSYFYPAGDARQLPWFAKHRADVPGVFYQFKEDQFVAFQAVAYSPQGQEALSQEAHFLFGPGRLVGDRTEWNGQKAWASLRDNFIYGHPVKLLDVRSHPLLDAPSANEQARLKAENAH